MQIRIKTKLSLGLGFLFAVIILIGSMGAVYIYKIAQESKEILKDNYESIEYAKSMMQTLDAPVSDSSSSKIKFENNLKLQEDNVTELGEIELTQELRRIFEETKNNFYYSLKKNQLKQVLYQVSEINMQAIVRKNNQTQIVADKVLSYMGIIGGFCFLIVFTFIINFPGYIADPIKKLTESIKQIASRNYSQRLYFKSNDEFGELAEAFNIMAQKLDNYENSNLAKIMFEKKRIETIISNMKDAVIGLNEKRIILFANSQACQLLGVNEKDIVGKYAPDIALTNDLLRTLISVQVNNESIKIFADGKESYFTKENIAITSDEKAIGEVILLKNITRFQELDLAKTNFIATISHELKTPIASIKLSSKLLEDSRVGSLNKEQAQLISNIKEESERLLKITAEVLNMAQVETGKIQLSFREVEPKNIIQYTTDALKFQVEQKGIKLMIECPDNLPKVYADLEKTVWVMVNLLNNAIRYSPANEEIIISAKVLNNQVLFSVQDHGKGIDAKYQDKIFDKFFQIPGTKESGTGLGLAIAKEFIIAQNGEINLKSELDKGTTFFFLLPVV